jgi:arylsulfatase
VKGRSHTIVADVEIPPEGAEGALLNQGSILGGYTLYVADDHLHYVHNYLGRSEDYLVSSEPVPRGKCTLGFAFETAGPFQGGAARLTIDGRTVAEGAIARFTPVRFSITDAGLYCGEDGGSAITQRYRGPFRFTGTLHTVTVTLAGAAALDADAHVEAKLRTQ